ncbi:MAG: tRNA epoxyqueuosine(34) reductase QueG [Candidatus Solibacter usitatus]|nr:tRNA epoxyqueuosine(34) reductase QueG [Candidatus Solibacter usitatus]
MGVNSSVVKRIARECGFELAGVSSALPARDGERYVDWAERGMAGRMAYLTDHRADIRLNPNELLDGVRSVISVGKVYNWGGETAGISRYAWGGDYHLIMREALCKMATALRELASFEYRIAVDTAPVLERSYARMAGLGWIGKNTCLINQGLGSWVFLGELLTTLELEPDVPPADRCGTCTRCIDACPTDAIVPRGDGWELDARLCISYFTIELRGEVPEEHRAAMAGHVFGCDICQDVCPWNRRAAVTDEPAFAPRGGVCLEEMAAMSEAEFRERYRDTPVSRARYQGFLRNVAIAMGNSGSTKYRPALERMAASADEVVSSHARWALDRIE